MLKKKLIGIITLFMNTTQTHDQKMGLIFSFHKWNQLFV